MTFAKIASTIGIGIVLAAGCFIFWAQRAASSKVVSRATAVVDRKEHVTFNDPNPSFEDEAGRRVPIRQGDEQWRVYYLIDDFLELDNETKSDLLASERERVTEGHQRFIWYSDGPGRLYDAAKPGDKLSVIFQRVEGGKIRIVTVEVMQP